jgi:hypothetical protein
VRRLTAKFLEPGERRIDMKFLAETLGQGRDNGWGRVGHGRLFRSSGLQVRRNVLDDSRITEAAKPSDREG